jgi:DNA-binding phage protein
MVSDDWQLGQFIAKALPIGRAVGGELDLALSFKSNPRIKHVSQLGKSLGAHLDVLKVAIVHGGAIDLPIS